MLDNLKIPVSDIATWIAILISVAALYYSRKALRHQVRQGRKRLVALINIRTMRDGIQVINPDGSALRKAEVYYHHRWFGTHYVPHIDIEGEELGPEFQSQFPSVARLREQLRRQRAEYASLSPPSGRVSSVIWRLFAFKHRPKRPWRCRPLRAKHGEVAIAEIYLTDASGEEWYLNTSGAKRHVPRRAIPRAAFRAARHLRLIGYPIWSNFNSVHWYSIVLCTVITTLALDHYLNGGHLLVKILLTLGARPA